MAALTAPAAPVRFPSTRRLSTQPTKLQHAPAHAEALSSENDGGEDLYSHPAARIFSFTAPSIQTMSKEVGTLPWASRSERVVAVGALRIYRLKGSVAFLHAGQLFLSLLPRSQCWCVDGESKFAMRIQSFIYRIELPYNTEEERSKVEELKEVMKKVLQYETTACPFRRGFTVDLPEVEPEPSRRTMRLLGPKTQGKTKEYDDLWGRRTTTGAYRSAGSSDVSDDDSARTSAEELSHADASSADGREPPNQLSVSEGSSNLDLNTRTATVSKAKPSTTTETLDLSESDLSDQEVVQTIQILPPPNEAQLSERSDIPVETTVETSHNHQVIASCSKTISLPDKEAALVAPPSTTMSDHDEPTTTPHQGLLQPSTIALLSSLDTSTVSTSLDTQSTEPTTTIDNPHLPTNLPPSQQDSSTTVPAIAPDVEPSQLPSPPPSPVPLKSKNSSQSSNPESPPQAQPVTISSTSAPSLITAPTSTTSAPCKPATTISGTYKTQHKRKRQPHPDDSLLNRTIKLLTSPPGDFVIILQEFFTRLFIAMRAIVATYVQPAGHERFQNEGAPYKRHMPLLTTRDTSGEDLASNTDDEATSSARDIGDSRHHRTKLQRCPGSWHHDDTDASDTDNTTENPARHSNHSSLPYNRASIGSGSRTDSEDDYGVPFDSPARKQSQNVAGTNSPPPMDYVEFVRQGMRQRGGVGGAKSML